MGEPAFFYAKSKAQIICAVIAQLIGAFIFATWIVQSLYSLNPKLQFSSIESSSVAATARFVSSPEYGFSCDAANIKSCRF